jgi:3',5'-cyclic AMP phosphodiesterase CpdA
MEDALAKAQELMRTFVAATATPTLVIPGNPAVSAYPNPARDKVWFTWGTKTVESARVEVYNLVGERISEIKIDQPQSNRILWIPDTVANGIYLYRLILTSDGKEDKQPIQKIVIIK